MTKNRHMN